MVLKARIRVRHTGCISERLSSGAHAAQVCSDRDGEILVMRGTAEQLDAFVAEVERAQGLPPQVLTRTDSSVVVRGRHPGGGVVHTIHSHGCNILWPAIFQEGREQYTLVAPDRARLDSLLKSLNALGDARLERVMDLSEDVLEPPVTVTDLTHDLTQKQLAVLRRAIDMGYYESPRRTSSEALAQSFGLSRSTLDEHLRKAESRVLERFAQALRAHPEIEKEAMRPPRAARAGLAGAPE